MDVAKRNSEYRYIINVEWYLLYCFWHMRHIHKFIYTCACVPVKEE